jgi:hypothetical protein
MHVVLSARCPMVNCINHGTRDFIYVICILHSSHSVPLFFLSIQGSVDRQGHGGVRMAHHAGDLGGMRRILVRAGRWQWGWLPVGCRRQQEQLRQARCGLLVVSGWSQKADLKILYADVCMLLHANFYASCVMDVFSWRYFRSSFLCLWVWRFDVVEVLCFMCKSLYTPCLMFFILAGGVVARCIYASCVSRIFRSSLYEIVSMFYACGPHVLCIVPMLIIHPHIGKYDVGGGNHGCVRWNVHLVERFIC